MKGCGESGPTWIVNNTTATKRWREDYEALAEQAGDIASDRRESASRRKAAKRLAGTVKRYLALGVRGKDRNWFKLCRFGRAAEDRVAEMDRIGGQMQRLALRLRLAQVGQPVYVSFETVQDDVLNHRMACESKIVTAWAADRPNLNDYILASLAQAAMGFPTYKEFHKWLDEHQAEVRTYKPSKYRLMVHMGDTLACKAKKDKHESDAADRPAEEIADEYARLIEARKAKERDRKNGKRASREV